MKKKRRILFCCTGLALLALTLAIYAFSRHGKGSADQSAVYYVKNYGGAVSFGTKDGYYHKDENGFLYFSDFSSKKDVIVCNKPNCPHKTWSEETTPDEERCHAYLPYEDIGFTYNDRLYIMSTVGFKPAKIVRSTLDRREQTKIAEFELDHIDPIVVIGNMMYTTNTIFLWEEDEDGLPVLTGATRTWIFSVDLNSGSITKLTEEQENFNAQLKVIGAYRNKLYCNYSYFEAKFDGTNLQEANPRQKGFIYDLENGQYQESEIDFPDASYMIDQFIVSVKRMDSEPPAEAFDPDSEEYAITILDMNTGENKQAAVAKSLPAHIDGKILYDAQNDSGDIQHYTYDIRSDKITQRGGGIVFDPMYVFDSYIYGIQYNNEDGRRTPYLILKKDFYDSAPNLIAFE